MDETQSLLPKLQQDMEDIRIIMHQNLFKTRERDSNLVELDQRADRLCQSSMCFERTTRNGLRNQQWGKECRIGVCYVFFVLVVIIIIMSIIVVGTREHWL